MKAQFKYTIKTGLAVRGAAFAVIFIMDALFIIFASVGLLPIAGKITAVSLGGVAISVMLVFNIIGDIAVMRRMFNVPEAYLYALMPAPRWKILLASVITAAVMDIITMAFVISAEVWLSLNMVGEEVWKNLWNYFSTNSSNLLYGLYYALLLTAGYLLIMMVILFCVTMKKSLFYRFPASGLLTFLLGCGCFYVISLLQLILTPFGTIQRWGLMVTMTFTPTSNVLPFYALLTLLEAAALFVITSKLMERKINL